MATTKADLTALGAVLTGRAVEHGGAIGRIVGSRRGADGRLLVQVAGRKRFVAAARVRVAGALR